MATGILITFVIGYVLIALEHKIHINKAASALLTGVLCWVIYIVSDQNYSDIVKHLTEHLGEISGILFFLLGAMTIVELIDAHDGFDVVTARITTKSERKLLWILSFITFFLSALIDNLTATIVIISLLRKLVPDLQKRLYFAGMVIIASNAGGAWSPIGDVTTTMLWIGGQVTSGALIVNVFLPSLICLLIPLSLLSLKFKGTISIPENLTTAKKYAGTSAQRNLIFFSGMGVLVLIPVFKTLTHLPPFMGMLLGLGILWIISELIHKDRDEEEKGSVSVVNALRKIDSPSILFFLGILLAVSALQMTGQLQDLSSFLDRKIGDTHLIVLTIGLISAVIDNVPLVAASIGMYDLATYPTDHYFWQFLAYCSGTGGSALIIGTAAGVAAMGLEKISFTWYLKKISWLALIGYLGGALIFILQQQF
jgi:Na+/H+ antiporter NhaD/arsenite permease-like protein